MSVEKFAEYEKVIIAVQKYPNLYDTSRPDYKDQTKRGNSWIAVAEETELSKELAKKHWQYLRDKLGKTLKTKKKPTGSAAGRKHATGVLPDDIVRQLEFLKPFLNPRKYVSPIH